MLRESRSYSNMLKYIWQFHTVCNGGLRHKVNISLWNDQLAQRFRYCLILDTRFSFVYPWIYGNASCLSVTFTLPTSNIIDIPGNKSHCTELNFLLNRHMKSCMVRSILLFHDAIGVYMVPLGFPTVILKCGKLACIPEQHFKQLLLNSLGWLYLYVLCSRTFTYASHFLNLLEAKNIWRAKFENHCSK